MAASEKALRESIVAAAARIAQAGFGDASSGDISARFAGTILITPAGTPWRALRPAMLALMPLGGEYGAWKGPTKPAAEWRIHLDVARARPDVGAVVRFQSPYATALAMAHKAIPAAHPTIALFGASEIQCTKYAPMGSKDLAELALAALGEGHAALLGNYGALATGDAQGRLRPRRRTRDAGQILRHRAFGRTAARALGRRGVSHRRASEDRRGRHRGAHGGARRRVRRAGQRQAESQGRSPRAGQGEAARAEAEGVRGRLCDESPGCAILARWTLSPTRPGR